MYTKCYAHNCLIFSCKCHIFCFFIGIKFNIDKVAPTRNNLKTPKISRRFAPEMYTIWRKPHYQENLPKYTYFGVFGVKKLKIKFSIKKKNNTVSAITSTCKAPPQGPVLSPLPKDRCEGLVSRPKGVPNGMHLTP